jgi:hypothetical protein
MHSIDLTKDPPLRRPEVMTTAGRFHALDRSLQEAPVIEQRIRFRDPLDDAPFGILVGLKDELIQDFRIVGMSHDAWTVRTPGDPLTGVRQIGSRGV